jgi:hypothetical protein
VRRDRVTDKRSGARSVDGGEGTTTSTRVRPSSGRLKKVEDSEGNIITKGSNRSAENANKSHSANRDSRSRNRRQPSRENIELFMSESDPDDEELVESTNHQSGRNMDDPHGTTSNTAVGLDDARDHRTSGGGRRRRPMDESSRSHSPKRDSHSRGGRRQPSSQNLSLQLSGSDGDDPPTSKPRSRRGSSRRLGTEDEINKEVREKRSNRKEREFKPTMADVSGSSTEQGNAENAMADGSAKDNKLSDNSRNRDRKDGRRMSDDSKNHRARRMSDDSKNRDLRTDARRMSEESRRDREGRRHPEGKRRPQKIVSDKSSRDKEGRRMKDDSEDRPRRRRNDQNADMKRERRERVMRSKDSFIPPPDQNIEEAAEAKDYPFSRSSFEGPSDMAHPEPRPSRTIRRPSNRSPLDLPPPAASHVEDYVGETTWQRGAHIQEASSHRRGQTRQPRRVDLTSAASRLSHSPTVAPRRQAGRLNRGANVRQSQMLHMVQLKDNGEPSEEIEQLSEIEEAELDGEEDESAAEFEPGVSSSEHPQGHMRSLGKAAVKASAVVAKTSASAATLGAKAAGKAATSGAKAAGKAVIGVLGFRKKKKHYANPESSAAGLIMDDLQDSGEHLDLRDTDEDFGQDSSGEHL